MEAPPDGPPSRIAAGVGCACGTRGMLPSAAAGGGGAQGLGVIICIMEYETLYAEMIELLRTFAFHTVWGVLDSHARVQSIMSGIQGACT